MKIKTKASIQVNASQQEVWDYVTDAANFPKYFGVEKIEIITGEPKMAGGVKQRVATTDGRVAEEQFLDVREPEYFDYEVLGGFDFPFDLFVRKGGASWTISPADPGSTITWDYYFDLTSSLVSPVGAVLVKFFFKHAMAAALKQIKQQLEN
jgi:uncharacterized protein YndB with AHSA1/START domain